MRIKTSLLVVTLAGGTAAAGPFVHIQRFDGDSRVGADVTYIELDTGDSGAELTTLRFDLHAHYVHPTSQAGFYVQVPYGYISTDDDSASAMGNLEVGGLYMPAALTGPLKIVLRGGLTLPTAPDDSDAEVGIIAAFPRIHDLYQAIPSGVTARLGGSVLYNAGQAYVRGDLGIDINLAAAENVDVEPAVHLNGGVGVYVAPTVALTGELSTLTSFEDNSETLINLGIGARFFGGSVQPYLGVVLPVSDEIGDAMDFAFVVGLDARI